MLSALEWVEMGSWRDVTEGPGRTPIREYAAAFFKRQHKRLLRRGANIDRLAPDDRHAVRIRAKKLRYVGELLVGLYAGRRAAKRHKALLNALSSLQEHLGALNDTAIGDDLIRSLAGTDGSAREARFDFATGLLAPATGTATDDPRLKRATEAYDELARSKPFWR
jgi:CHAD domain-containing protein